MCAKYEKSDFNSSWKIGFSLFSHMRAWGSQFDLYVQTSNVSLGSSLEQIQEASSSQCLIPNFKIPSFLVLKKKIFKRDFFTIYGMVAIMVNKLEPYLQTFQSRVVCVCVGGWGGGRRGAKFVCNTGYN